MSTSRPNIICFVTDQQRADHLGCMGNPDLKTPNIDRLAREGVVFTESFVANVVCMPNRASMFTGRYPKAHRVRENGITLPLDEVVLPEVLRRAGYQTASFGKIHLAPFCVTKETVSHEYELYESIEHWKQGGELPLPYYGLEHIYYVGAHVNGAYGHYKRDLDRDHPGMHEKLDTKHALPPMLSAHQAWRIALPEELHYNTAIADKTIEYIKARNADQPFFAWCSFPDPHHPCAAPRPWCDMYDPKKITFAPPRAENEFDLLPPYCREAFEGRQPIAGLASDLGSITDEQYREILAMTYGMISMVDHNVGRVVNSLEELGLLDDTIVVFLSDHGDFMGDHRLLFKGAFLYRGLARVPTVWRLPERFRARGERDALVSTVDLMPTLLELAGLDIPNGVQGISCKDILTGETDSVRDWAYIEYDENYLREHLRQIRSKDWAITYLPSRDSGTLFDLRNDPDELNNLWDNPDYEAKKNELLLELLKQTSYLDDWLPAKTVNA